MKDQGKGVATSEEIGSAELGVASFAVRHEL